MKTKPHVGNVTLILDRPAGHRKMRLLLGLKRRENKSDEKRTRKRVGSNRWMLPGGATETTDKSQKHAAQREVLQETGFFFPLKDFGKAGILRGYVNDDPLWVVHIYVVTAAGTNVASPNGEYVDMVWFPILKLPFDNMLSSDKLWIPRLAMGEKLMINLSFKDYPDQLVGSSIREIETFK